jgi:hypothetical protein
VLPDSVQEKVIQTAQRQIGEASAVLSDPQSADWEKAMAQQKINALKQAVRNLREATAVPVKQESNNSRGKPAAGKTIPAEDSQGSSKKAKPVSSRLKPDPELSARVQRDADSLRTLSKDAGWAEQGGRLLRDQDDNVTGRTAWLPNAEWFRAGMEGDPAVLAQAIDDLVAGRGVKAKSRRTIESMMEWWKPSRPGKRWMRILRRMTSRLSVLTTYRKMNKFP